MNTVTERTKIFKKSKKYYAMIGMFIMTIAVVHFGLQMIFIQKENLETVKTEVEIENNFKPAVEKKSSAKQIIEIEPEQVEVKKVEVITITEPVKPALRQRQEAASAPKPAKKKEARETRAERLRRAERILTGV